jgi:hypothetical protein
MFLSFFITNEADGTIFDFWPLFSDTLESIWRHLLGGVKIENQIQGSFVRGFSSTSRMFPVPPKFGVELCIEKIFIKRNCS